MGTVNLPPVAVASLHVNKIGPSMRNPITQHRKFFALYLSLCVLLALSLTAVMVMTEEAGYWEATVKGCMEAITFGAVGLIIWYVVRFSGLEANHLWNTLVSHLAAATILLSLWVVTSYSLSAWVLGMPVAIRQLPQEEVTNQLAWGLGLYLLAALGYYLLIFYQNYREKLVDELEMKAMLKESELSMLKAQLNPHFIFNSLNSISMLTLTRPDDAHEMIVKLSNFLRHTIGHPESELVSLTKELATTRLYLDIEKSRFGEKLQVEIEEGELEGAYELPNLILQPLVENAIKYGVYEALDRSIIRVRAYPEGDDLLVEIANSCDEEPARSTGKGIGLKNVQGRMKYHYDRDDLVTAHQNEGMFTATIRIPQKSNA